MSDFTVKLESINVKKTSEDISTSLKRNESLYSSIEQDLLAKTIEEAILTDLEYLKMLAKNPDEYYDENKGYDQMFLVIKKHLWRKTKNLNDIGEDIADAWDEYLDEIKAFEWQ